VMWRSNPALEPRDMFVRSLFNVKLQKRCRLHRIATCRTNDPEAVCRDCFSGSESNAKVHFVIIIDNFTVFSTNECSSV